MMDGSSEKSSGFVRRSGFECKFAGSESWVILSPIEQSIKRKIEAVGTPLKDWDVSINYGIKTGCNEAFIVDEERRSEILSWCKSPAERKRTDELIRPILRGRDIKRYGYDWAHLYLIATHNGIPEKGIPRIDVKDYPAIKRHLDQYWDKISVRADMGDTPYNLRSCAYMDDFSKPKIVWAELVRTGNAFVSDADGFMVGNTGYVLTTSDSPERTLPHLLGVLNSKIMLYYLDQISTKMDVTGWRWLRQHVELLPIAPLMPDRSLESLSALTTARNQVANKRRLDDLVGKAYGLTKDEMDYIRIKTGPF